MPKIRYIDKTLGAKALAVVAKANEIIQEYQAQGFTLTLRQLYYQFVSRDLIANKQTEYKRLGDIISDARLCGLIDWNAIEDRLRSLEAPPFWSDPAAIIEVTAQTFNVDFWANQDSRPEVWIEKDALSGIFDSICTDLQVPFFACRGYTSQSALWRAGMRLKRHVDRGQTPLILHFGDHDPSGMDMTRDITDRLALFSGGTVEVQRLALNMDQVEQYGPPPNPAKLTDSRAAQYIQIHGDESWELDALDPTVLRSLVTEAIDKIRDPKAWREKTRERDLGREDLRAVSDRWEEVKEFLGE